MDASFAGLGASNLPEATAAWLLTYAIHSTIMLGGVWFLTHSWVRVEVLQDVLWKAALVGSLITATTQSAIGWTPALHMKFPSVAEGVQAPSNYLLSDQARERPTVGTASPFPAPLGAPDQALRGAVPATLTQQRVAPRTAIRWVSAVGWLWLIGATACLLRFAIARARFTRRLRPRHPVAEGDLPRLLAMLCRKAGVRRPVRITCSQEINTPIAIGAREICLPPRALAALDTAKQQSMLAHELAHLVRSDPAWLTVAGLLENLFFFQPLHRLGRRRLQAVAENLCDEWAVRQTGDRTVLAKCLVEVAGWTTAARRTVAVTGMAENRVALFQRVERLLGEAPRPLRPWALATGRLLSTGGILLLVGCLAPGVSANPPAAPALPGPHAEEPAAPGTTGNHVFVVSAAADHEARDMVPPEATRAFCWHTDGLQPNPDCSVTIRMRNGGHIRLDAAAVRSAPQMGFYRIEEPGGSTVRRLEVGAIEFHEEKSSVLLIEVPADGAASSLPDEPPAVPTPW